MNERKRTINIAFASWHVLLKKPCLRFLTRAFVLLGHQDIIRLSHKQWELPWSTNLIGWIDFDRGLEEMVVYHLLKKSGNVGWNVNGKIKFVTPNGNFLGKTGFLPRETQIPLATLPPSLLINFKFIQCVTSRCDLLKLLLRKKLTFTLAPLFPSSLFFFTASILTHNSATEKDIVFSKEAFCK